MKQLFKVGQWQLRPASVVGRTVLGVVVSLATGSLSAQAQDVPVGAQFSLSGPAAAYAGPNLRAAVELGVEQVNSAQSLGAGRKMKLILDDNSGVKTQAIALVNKQATADNVIAIVGPQGSDLALPAAPVANDLKVPILTLGGSAAIVQAGPWSFMALAPAESLVAESVKLAVDKLKIKSVGVVFDRTNDSSVRIKNAFEGAMKAHGIKVVATEGVAPQDTNFGPLATKLANTDMDALYVESPPAVQANVFIQVRQAGLDTKVKLLASPNAASPQFISVGGEAVNGVYYPTLYVATLDTPENKHFVESYRRRMNAEPDYLAALGYNCIMVVADAIKTAGSGADRDKVRIALGNVRDLPSLIGTGRYSIGKDRMPEYTNVMLQVVAGKLVIVPLD